jgi:hypothetical protein
MSTHCYICYIDATGRVETIYINHDGYLKGVGLTLLKKYNTEKEVIDLMVDGSRDSLNPEYAKEKNLYYDSRKIFNSMNDLIEDIKKRRDIEFTYLWNEEKAAWYYFEDFSIDQIRHLKHGIAALNL